MAEIKALFPMRINKYLAYKGYATRKDADVLISKGFVELNGRTAVLGDKVGVKDTVKVSGIQKTHHYYAYYKPIGIITHSPQSGEKDIAAHISLKGVFPVGRLDRDSSGLIILTDDGRITDRLLKPEYEHEKEYRVETKRALPFRFKKRMESGVDIEGYMTKPCTVTIESRNAFSITLSEGKKHQIRRMCAALGAEVASLERVRVMNIELAGLAPGEYRELYGTQLKNFLYVLGL